MAKLSSEDINRRLIQWRNDRLLESKRKARMERLERENAELRATVAAQQEIIERLFLRVEQLEAMVFGKGKKKKPDDHDELPPPSSGFESSKKERDRASYRRPRPKPEELTNHSEHFLKTCSDCRGPLGRREMVRRCVEDIPLAKKTVTEMMIERGFCSDCNKTKSARLISPQHVSLGPNVRLYVLFAVTILGLTFEKIKAHLQGMHELSISDGEIALIIREGHRNLLPEMQEIATKIRAAPAAHYDETSWPMQSGGEGTFAWVKTSAMGPETIFRLGRSRGKGNAEELRGEPSNQVGVTDDYGSYDALFKNHALCWAHPLRKFRDLAKSGVLSQEHHERCRSFYERFHLLERSIALTLATPIETSERDAAAMKFGKEINTLMLTDPRDPLALRRLKTTFLRNREKYLVCLRISHVPMTNNKAERSLRHLVIKRLLSFGSRSQQGAQAMETLLSVLLTLWWSKPKDYFGSLQALVAQHA